MRRALSYAGKHTRFCTGKVCGESCNITLDRYAPNQIDVCIEAHFKGHGYMQSCLQLSSLADRCRIIRLSSAELARKAGVDKFTVYRAFRGSTGTLHASALAIERALVAEERRVLAALTQLHPSEACRALDAPPVAPSLPAGGATLSEVAA